MNGHDSRPFSPVDEPNRGCRTRPDGFHDLPLVSHGTFTYGEHCSQYGRLLDLCAMRSAMGRQPAGRCRRLCGVAGRAHGRVGHHASMKDRSDQTLVHDLRELIAALDARAPRLERAGEREIAHDAQTLRRAALERIEELERSPSVPACGTVGQV